MADVGSLLAAASLMSLMQSMMLLGWFAILLECRRMIYLTRLFYAVDENVAEWK